MFGGDQETRTRHGQGRDLGPEHWPKRGSETPAAVGSATKLRPFPAREVLEETGYRVEVGALTGVYKNMKLGGSCSM